jgi:serine phosphatase RsbU (regulator of sigma subunit)
VWRRAGGSIESLAGHGPALGMVGDFDYRESSTIELAEGDLLLAYTDGLSEARSKDAPEAFLGEDGLSRVLQTVAPSATSARDIGQAIVEAAHAHARGHREDDLTIFVVRRGRA